MATCHGGVGQPLERDATLHGKDTDIQNNFHHEDLDNFENAEQENHTNLVTLTWELDNLCHRVQAGEGQPKEALHHIECELQRLSIVLHPSALPEPLDFTIHRNLMFCPKADNLCEHPNSGYTYLQWQQFNTVRGLVSGH